MLMLRRPAATCLPAVLAATVLVVAAGPASAELRFCSREDLSLPLSGPVAVAAADFYGGDGIPDLAITFSGSGSGGAVVLLENDGTGTFTPRDTLTSPGPTTASHVADGPTAIIAADFTDDGRPDIAGVNRGIDRFFAYGNPGIPGTWGAPLDSDAARGAAFDLTSGDWDGDGFRDLVFASESGQVTIALWDMALGQWRNAFRSNVAGGVGFLTDVEMGDFITLPGDPASGVTDVLTVDTTTPQLVIWPGDRVISGTVLFGPGQLVPIATTVPGFGPVHPFEAIVRDFEPDGRLDALVGTTEGFLLYYRGNGMPSVFDAPVVTDVVGPRSLGPTRTPSQWTAMAYADVVPGGGLDLVIADVGERSMASGANWLTVLPGLTNSPRPTFDVAAQEHYAAGAITTLRPGSLVVANFDAMAGNDVILLNGGNPSMTLFRNDGTGGLDAAPSYATGGVLPRGVATGDVDGDGDDDVLVALGDAPVLLEADAGGLLAPTLLGSTTERSPRNLQLASIDDANDAIPDLLVSYGVSHVLHAGNGDGTFDAPRVLPGIAGDVVLGDFAGSGSVDIVSADSANQVHVWEGSGIGTFTMRQTLTGVWRADDLVAGDFFGGAREDVIVAGTTVGAELGLFVIRYDDLNMRYAAPEFLRATDLLGIDVQFPFLAVTQLGGDSRPDVLAMTSAGFAVSLINDGTTFTLDMASMPISLLASPTAMLYTDLTGDGIADIAVASGATIGVREGLGGPAFGPLVLLSGNISTDALGAADLDGDGLPELVAGSRTTGDVTVFCNASVGSLILRVGRPLSRDTLHWTAQDPGTTFDVARGSLGLMWANRDLSDATCLASGLATSSFVDPTPAPAPPATWGTTSGWYYMVRCTGGSCTEPTFGVDSFGVERYAVGMEPCP